MTGKLPVSIWPLVVNNQSTWEVVENHPLTPAPVAGGIILDAMVRLGSRGAGGIRRVVVLRWPGMKEDLIMPSSVMRM